MRKSKYDGSLCKGDTKAVYARAVQETVNEKEYSE